VSLASILNPRDILLYLIIVWDIARNIIRLINKHRMEVLRFNKNLSRRNLHVRLIDLPPIAANRLCIDEFSEEVKAISSHRIRILYSAMLLLQIKYILRTVSAKIPVLEAPFIYILHIGTCTL